MKKIISLIMICLLLSSCTTDLLQRKSYKETFQNFLITEDNKQLVILGEKYHYIFPLDNNLKRIITWKHVNLLNLELSYLHVKQDNSIYVSFDLKAKKDGLTAEQIKWLNGKGFIEYLRDRSVVELRSKINGKRYSKEEDVNYTNKNLEKFSKKYKVTINEDLTKSDKIARAPLTPIAVAADLTLFAGIIALAPVLMMIGCASSGGKGEWCN